MTLKRNSPPGVGTLEIVLLKIPILLQHRFIHVHSHLFFIVLVLKQEPVVL